MIRSIYLFDIEFMEDKLISTNSLFFTEDGRNKAKSAALILSHAKSAITEYVEHQSFPEYIFLFLEIYIYRKIAYSS